MKDNRHPSDPPLWATILVVTIFVAVFFVPALIILTKFMWRVALG